MHSSIARPITIAAALSQLCFTSDQAPSTNILSDLPGIIEGDAKRIELLTPLIGNEAPSIQTTQWLNSGPKEISDFKGNIVVLDFWATWCNPCLKSIPELNALATKYKDQGVVVIGVCYPEGAEKLRETVDTYKIEYPVCVATNWTQVSTTYHVDTFPDTYIIGRDGKMVVPDCKSLKVEPILRELLRK